MGHILLTALNKHRNYITDACASARHASALCAADGHARACVRGGARYTHGHRDAQDVGTPPAQPPFSSQHKSSCDTKPTPVTVIPCLAHIFRGGIWVSLYLLLEINLLSN